MKVLIAYYSETGNTERVARAMWEAVSEEHEVTLTTVPELSVDVFDGFKLVVLGAAVHDSDLAKPLKRLLEALPMNPRFNLAGFATHAVYVPDGSAHKEELHERWAGKCLLSFEDTCREKSIQFLGYFHCQGAASQPIEEFIHREIITVEEEWKEYLPELRKHPTPEDLQNAKDFARKIIDKL
ncbi:MAG: flavodoxin family protein [Candidatus Hermodarchaeota archaeon]